MPDTFGLGLGFDGPQTSGCRVGLCYHGWLLGVWTSIGWLSRVKDPLCLQIINYNIDTIKGNPQFKEFEHALKYDTVGQFAPLTQYSWTVPPLTSQSLQWWYPILNNDDLLHTICWKNGQVGKTNTVRCGVPDSNHMVTWIKKYGPLTTYRGWKSPSSYIK
jgi:hypothetical protein